MDVFCNIHVVLFYKDGVCKMSLSPSGTVLAVVHHSGMYSLWDIPSLRKRTVWKQQDQPGFNEINPEVAENPKKRKQMKGEALL